MAQMPFLWENPLSNSVMVPNTSTQLNPNINVGHFFPLQCSSILWTSLCENRKRKEKSKQQIYMGNYNVVLKTFNKQKHFTYDVPCWEWGRVFEDVSYCSMGEGEND